jgi:O-antigen/teichoic acid export membrane protein
MASPPAKARGLGTGGISIGFAKLFFLIAGYTVSIYLTRLVSPATYGDYNVLSQIITIPNMVLIQTLLFAVSRPMSAEFPAGLPSYDGLRRRGFRVALVAGGLVASFLFLGAGPVAGYFLGDPALADPLRIVAPIPLIYAVYAVNVGTLNAIRRFQLQATLDVVMAGTKAALIIGAAALGFGLGHILGGFTLASLLALALSAGFVVISRPAGAGGGTGPLPPMASFAAVLAIFTAGVNLLQGFDLFVLKRLATTQAMEDAVGFYSSAALIARVPYSMMAAVSLVMFPLIATLHAARDEAEISRHVGGTARISALLLAFMSSVGASAAPEVQRLLFPAAYAAAADELRLLVWGLSGYSLTVTAAWIFNSAHRSRAAIALIAVPLLTVAALSLTLAPTHFTTGAAISVAVAGGLGALVSLLALTRVFKARVSTLYLAKLAAAAVMVEVVARLWSPAGKLGILAKLAALALVFIAVVTATRAVQPAELRALRRRPPGPPPTDPTA